MMSRLFLAIALCAASFAASHEAWAQSPAEFIRQQQRQQELRRERQAPQRPARPATPPAAQPAPTESTAPAAAPAVAAPRAPTNLAPPPYEKDLRRIAEILGTLHYLRPLCGANDGPAWRDKMRDLMDADAGPPDRRERLAGAFNQGFNSFQTTYRTCTPSADLAVRRYLEEGARLTREIATRHGG